MEKSDGNAEICFKNQIICQKGFCRFMPVVLFFSQLSKDPLYIKLKTRSPKLTNYLFILKLKLFDLIGGETMEIVSCTACGRQVNHFQRDALFRHPVLKVLICKVNLHIDQ